MMKKKETRKIEKENINLTKINFHKLDFKKKYNILLKTIWSKSWQNNLLYR